MSKESSVSISTVKISSIFSIDDEKLINQRPDEPTAVVLLKTKRYYVPHIGFVAYYTMGGNVGGIKKDIKKEVEE